MISLNFLHLTLSSCCDGRLVACDTLNQLHRFPDLQTIMLQLTTTGITLSGEGLNVKNKF